jgi:tetratricopeptide (TPR) repeat protein
MKLTLTFFTVLLVAPLQAASVPAEYQAALRLYGSNKFPEAKTAFAALIASAPTAEAKDAALMQASYCEVQMKHVEEAAALASGIKDKYLGTLCRMNLLTMQSKYAEVVALVKDEDFSTWPDAMIFDVLMCRGNSLSRTREAVAAEKDFRAALGYTINDFKKATAHLRLGGLFKGQQALDCLDEVMKLKEPGATMRYQAIAARARILAADGKVALALAEFDRLNDLTKQPHWTMVQMARAATHEALGAPDKARACYEAVVASSNPPADSLATAKAKLSSKR